MCVCAYRIYLLMTLRYLLFVLKSYKVAGNAYNNTKIILNSRCSIKFIVSTRRVPTIAEFLVKCSRNDEI